MGTPQAVAVITGLIVNAFVILTPVMKVSNKLELIEYRVQQIERRMNKKDFLHQDSRKGSGQALQELIRYLPVDKAAKDKKEVGKR